MGCVRWRRPPHLFALFQVKARRQKSRGSTKSWPTSVPSSKVSQRFVFRVGQSPRRTWNGSKAASMNPNIRFLTERNCSAVVQGSLKGAAGSGPCPAVLCFYYLTVVPLGKALDLSGWSKAAPGQNRKEGDTFWILVSGSHVRTWNIRLFVCQFLFPSWQSGFLQGRLSTSVESVWILSTAPVVLTFVWTLEQAMTAGL